MSTTKELTAKQKTTADSLLKKHSKKRIYVNTSSGHMHFNEVGARQGARKPEDVLVYDGTNAVPAFVKAEDPKDAAKAADTKEAAKPAATKTPAKPAGKEAVLIPEGEPSKDWSPEQLVAYGKAHFPDLKLMATWKPETLLGKLEEAAAALAEDKETEETKSPE